MAKMATSGVGVRELPEAHTFDFILCRAKSPKKNLGQTEELRSN